MKAVVCAYSPIGTRALEALLETGLNIQALFTYPQPPEDRWFEAPAALAERSGIPVFLPKDFNAQEVHEQLQDLGPDFLFSFYFREMIRPHQLAVPKFGCYNLHGSMLPRYRGRAPINWVLLQGESHTGITLHRMTPRPDDGEVMAQKSLEIAWDETALSLTLRMADVASVLIREALPSLIAGTLRGLSQSDMGPSSYFGGRKPEDGRLSFSMTHLQAFNLIRAVTDPWPNAFIEGQKGRIEIPWALPVSEACPQGCFRFSREGVLLGFSDSALRLHRLRQGGETSERPSQHAEWLRAAGIPEAPTPDILSPSLLTGGVI